jgi:O-antigen/teichoic acid export membrane protein
MPIGKKSTITLYHACKSIFVASVPAWISQIIGVVGISVGTVIVFGIVGAGQAGSYFIASAIFYAVGSIRNSIFDIAFPIVSAMDDKRKRFVWRLIKMSLILTLPISWTVIVYSDEVMGLIGSDYLQASIALKILMLSMLTSTFNGGITTLVYSYGNYRKVLAIGLGSTLSRVLLYFILVPLFGNTGAAMSFTAGSIVGFVVSLIVAKKIGMNVFWKELGSILIIPTGLAFIIDYFNVNYIMGVPIVLVISLVLYFRLHILS